MIPDRTRRGLTLIEVLIAMTILTLAMGGLYGSFSAGTRVYKQAEEGLDRTQELRTFLLYLRRELGNMVPYEPVPFGGKPSQIEFPVLLRRYSSRGYEEGLYIVRYKILSDRIVREEESIKKKEGGGKEERKFIVLDHIRRGEFSFPFKDKDTEGVLWQEGWDPEDGLGTPKGIRLRMQLLSGEPASSVRTGRSMHKEAPPVFFDEQFFIPQGTWGKIE